MRAGAASNIGEVHLELNQPNQDNYFIDAEQQIFAVFDGHGDQGHVIAAYLKANISPTFTSSLSLSPSASIEDSMKSSFEKLEANICKDTSSMSSGSTCVMAYVANNNLNFILRLTRYIAGVGDCTALLVKANPASSTFNTTTLVPSHKITNPTEHERIVQTGASVSGDYIVSKSDPDKVINMTRAFGDQDMKSSGIISIPEISITNLSTNTEPERVTKKLKTDLETTPTVNSTDNTNNSNTAESTKTDSDNTKQADTINDGSLSDTFLLLFSDGLEQVQSFDNIVEKAYQLLCKNLTEKKDEQVPISTICSILLQKLEDAIVERDGVGFSDDATVILVLLSGFDSRN